MIGGAGALAASLVREGQKPNAATAPTLLQLRGEDHALGVRLTETTATLRTVILVHIYIPQAENSAFKFMLFRD